MRIKKIFKLLNISENMAIRQKRSNFDSNSSLNSPSRYYTQSGFTIVELLVVIVVIGILATIIIYSYGTIVDKTKTVAIKSDLENASNQLESYKLKNKSYPTALDENNCPSTPVASTRHCIQTSGGNTISYSSSGQSFKLIISDSNNKISFSISENDEIYNKMKTFIKTYGYNSYEYGKGIIQTTDGGYAIAGYYEVNSNPMIAKFDSDATPVWKKSLIASAQEYGYSIIQLNDGSYVIAGSTNTIGTGSETALIAKYDTNGTLLWTKLFQGSGINVFRSLYKTSDGGFVAAGCTSGYGAGGLDALIVKYDSNGNKIWNTTWGGTGAECAYSVIQTSDSGYVMAGYTSSYIGGGDSYEDAFIVKLNSDGSNKTWSKTIGGSFQDRINSIKQTTDGGYVVAGLARASNYFNDTGDALIARFDSAGNLLWGKDFGNKTSSEDSSNDVVVSLNGDFVVAGYTESFGAGGKDAFITKFNNSGSLIWINTFGGTGSEGAESIIETSDGGYAITGFADIDGYTNVDTFIAKYNYSGNIDNCSTTICINHSPTINNTSLSSTTPTGDVITRPSATYTTTTSFTDSIPSMYSRTIAAP